jgi:hypothetical protein
MSNIGEMSAEMDTRQEAKQKVCINTRHYYKEMKSRAGKYPICSRGWICFSGTSLMILTFHLLVHIALISTGHSRFVIYPAGSSRSSSGIYMYISKCSSGVPWLENVTTIWSMIDRWLSVLSVASSRKLSPASDNHSDRSAVDDLTNWPSRQWTNPFQKSCEWVAWEGHVLLLRWARE